MKANTLNKFRFGALAFALGCLSFLSCGTKKVQSSETDIIGGQATKPGDPGYTSAVGVIKVVAQGSDGSISYEICSGTLVAPNLVVTAAHCTADITRLDHAILVFGDDKDEAHNQFITNSIKNPITAVKAHPDHASQFLNDIGWVKFSGSIPSRFRPAPIFKSIEQVRSGTNISITGFGDYSSSQIGGQNRTTTTKFKRYYGPGEHGAGYFSTEGTNGSVCGGDSGGPAYMQSNGTWYLLGATSGPNWIEYGAEPSPTCEQRTGLFTYVGRHISWIESTSGVRVPSGGGVVDPGNGNGNGNGNASFQVNWNTGGEFISASGTAPSGTTILIISGYAQGSWLDLSEVKPTGTRFNFPRFYVPSYMKQLKITAYNSSRRALGTDETFR